MQIKYMSLFKLKRSGEKIYYVYKYPVWCPICHERMLLHEYCERKLAPNSSAYIPKYVCKSKGKPHYSRVVPLCFPTFTSYSLYFVGSVLEHPETTDGRLHRKYRRWFLGTMHTLGLAPPDMPPGLPERLQLPHYIDLAKSVCGHCGFDWLVWFVELFFDKIIHRL